MTKIFAKFCQCARAYDADNRITAAYTNSRTPLLSLDRPTAALSNELVENEDWENDANYYYYAHGPLARTEIGDKQLQGFDYLYNLQGWMKGINAISTENDPGQDGYSGINSIFGKDLAAFSLEYFNSDYQAINSTTPLAGVNATSHPASNSSQLFNGNIRYMQTRLTNLNTRASMPMLNAYKYDQLNRLKESRSYENGLSGSAWNPTTYGNEYFNSFIYDAMGNIENQIRHSRNGTLIDNLTYHYQKNSGKLVRNRLYHLNDAQTNSSAFTDDIDNMLTFRPQADRLNVNNNYNYDEEGRLVKDSSERISKIVWRVDGKVKEIQRNGGSVKWLRFDYDAMGNRIAKHVYNNTGTVLERSTYYILDAQGNQISTYDHEVVGETAQFNLKERNIFGSSRIGSKQDSLNILTATIKQNYTQVLGNKYYEFSNHLGNVLTVFNDLKIPLDENSDNIVDGFLVGITNSSDYSPFGVQLDGRTIQNDFYRRGFNGMEKDDEMKGGGNSYDFGARMFDSRVGRWLTIDPHVKKYPSSSPYNFVENNPIYFVDVDGMDYKPTTKESIIYTVPMTAHDLGNTSISKILLQKNVNTKRWDLMATISLKLNDALINSETEKLSPGLKSEVCAHEWGHVNQLNEALQKSVTVSISINGKTEIAKGRADQVLDKINAKLDAQMQLDYKDAVSKGIITDNESETAFQKTLQEKYGKLLNDAVSQAYTGINKNIEKSMKDKQEIENDANERGEKSNGPLKYANLKNKIIVAVKNRKTGSTVVKELKFDEQ